MSDGNCHEFPVGDVETFESGMVGKLLEVVVVRLVCLGVDCYLHATFGISLVSQDPQQEAVTNSGLSRW